MSEFSFKLPTEIIAGLGCISKLTDVCDRFGKSILFVYPIQLDVLALPYIEVLTSTGYTVTQFIQHEPEPTIDFVDQTAVDLSSTTFDVIVGFGGGSAMDLAKALSIALTQSEDVWMYTNTSNKSPLPLLSEVLPVITVPTTAGTGSEVTPYAVLSKTDTQQKGTIQETAVFPKVAIIDGTLMTGMPAILTAATGIDAFAHALEATINISKFSPMAKIFGKEAMRRIIDFLPKVLSEPENAHHRQEMSFAAALGGMAISHNGTTTCHAIAESLGALTKIPHGLTVSLATVPVLRHTIQEGAPALQELWIDVCGKKASDDAVTDATAFVDFLDAFIASTGLPRTVKDVLGANKVVDLADPLVDNIMKFKFRPLQQHPVNFDAPNLLPIVVETIFGAKS